MKVAYLLGGFVVALLLLAAAGYVGVVAGLVPANADGKPSKLERWAAKTSLRATIKRATAGISNPYPPDDEALSDGLKLYAANCAVCHGAADGEPSKLAKGFYVRAPLLAKDGVEDNPVSESFWKIKHGIRFTGMPSFGATLSDKELWEIAGFLERMDKLSPALDAEWKRVPSAAAK